MNPKKSKEYQKVAAKARKNHVGSGTTCTTGKSAKAKSGKKSYGNMKSRY